MGIILVVVIFLFMIGGIGGVLFWQIKRTDPKKEDTSMRTDNKRAQEFLPFESIQDSMIYLGNYQYRAIIDCGSINYNLKTQREQDIVDYTFQRFLNSLTHPITMFLHTKTMDREQFLNILKADIERTVNEYEGLQTQEYLAHYGEIHHQDFEAFFMNKGTGKEKKKYIIVPFDDAILMSEMNEDEKYEYVASELYSRCMLIIEQLLNVGITARILNTSEVVETLVSVYHRQNYKHIDGLLDGDFTQLVVSGRNIEEESVQMDKLRNILGATLLRIEQEARRGYQEEVNPSLENLKTDFEQSIRDMLNDIEQLQHRAQ